MTHEQMLKCFNKTVRPGNRVRMEIPSVVYGRTITEAKLVDGEPKVFVSSLVGPVPLRFVRPLGDKEFEL